jgi:hypothetical protein
MIKSDVKEKIAVFKKILPRKSFVIVIQHSSAIPEAGLLRLP